MIVALNEIESTVAKAARGAGYAWGLAEEAAQAARWLAANHLCWLPVLVELLERPAGWPAEPTLDLAASELRPRAKDGLLDPLVAGALLSDLAALLPDEPAELAIGPVACPLLLLPFIARVAWRRETALQVWWSGAGVLVGAAGAVTAKGSGLTLPRTERALCRAPDGSLPRIRPPRPGGREVDDALWARLGVLAARTYVPASEASRIEGAGAGVSDND
jgi:hypothetical protein